MADRVIVFLDYQNVYMGARGIFAWSGAPHMHGQVDPLALGEYLAADSPFDRELTQVRVYRGRPDSTKDPKGYGAATRQIAAWEAAGVHVTTRTLRYPKAWPAEKPQEKGIDVALALDFAMMGVAGEYDVGILMSTDTDLKPALEVVTERQIARGRPFPRAEVAAWSGVGLQNRRLSIKQRNLYCHWIDTAGYAQVEDLTDYSLP